MEFPEAAAGPAIAAALSEDIASDDVTTRWSVPEDLWAEADIITRQDGVAAGLPIVAAVFSEIDPRVEVKALRADGDRLRAGDVLVHLAGPARSLITGERTALNFLQRMCGIATSTDRYTREVADLPVRILDTRKTAPGLRALDKYAVTAGGGHNHRMSLAAMVLLKENHVVAAGGTTAAIRAVREGMAAEGRDLLIEVEVETVAEAEEALRAGASWIMLDNMSLPELAEVVRLRAASKSSTGSSSLLEASGTVTLDRLRPIAETGVDVISVGALTHSVTALDLSMLIGSVAPTALPE
jgi:nicotinate-nucleotide pyrophosphorylase (carboxylating)